jgi:hypothetical protein
METILTTGWFVPFFLTVWLGISGLISILGGWRMLAERFQASGFKLNPRERFRFRTLELGRLPLLPVHYNGCVTFGVAEQGLYIGLLFPFRFMHPPLMIPWWEIRSWKEGRFLWWHWIEVETAVEDLRLRIPWGVGDVAQAQWERSRSGVTR